MDNAYNDVKSGSYDYKNTELIRNRSVTNIVVQSLGAMQEEYAISYLIKSDFKVIRYEENGLRVINDGTFTPYRDESLKKSALANAKGENHYLASKYYKQCVFCGYEARIIFDTQKKNLVNISGYVFFHSI
jgi:hypothetical protein